MECLMLEFQKKMTCIEVPLYVSIVVLKETTQAGCLEEGDHLWHQAEDSDAWCQQVISWLALPYKQVFSFYTVFTWFWLLMTASDLLTRTTRQAGAFLLYRTYLWNKQQVMSINLIMCSTMQYHVVVNHVVFYVIQSQVRYNALY